MQKHCSADQLWPSVGWVGDAIKTIDKRRLPSELVVATLTSAEDVIDAVSTLAVGGAPAIGACGALGFVLGLDQHESRDTAESQRVPGSAVEEIGSARPGRTSPDGIGVWNAAVDITPGELIKAIITERDPIHPPHTTTISEILGDRSRQ